MLQKCASQKSYGSSGSNKGRQFFRCNAGLDPSAERALVGENFGARDPFAAEIESNFGEKVLGNYNTEHIIKYVLVRTPYLFVGCVNIWSC